MEIKITNEDGRWLLNGKRYHELSPDEKVFFDLAWHSLRSEIEGGNK